MLQKFILAIRYLLFPISLLYGWVMALRNKLYDLGILKSTSFDRSIIAIGNLSVGGTGKTPHTEYLIRFINKKYSLATLSRGYGRKTKGYILANSSTNASQIGDEPMQFFTKFPDISVAVCEDRVVGVKRLIEDVNPEIILLDDAFQHRAIKAGFYILLTPFDSVFTDDFMMPTGTLREFASGAKRANIIILTKCHLGKNKEYINNKIKYLQDLYKVKVYASFVDYDEQPYGAFSQELKALENQKVVLITGIAQPKPFKEYIEKTISLEAHLSFADHYNFTQTDVQKIVENHPNATFITTEKDYMRLKEFELIKDKLCYLPIKVKFIGESIDEVIENYINKS